MIAAQDLMIGDWVQHASDNYFKVTRIDMWGDGSTHFACGHPHLWDYNNKFSPIPLTAEILERNGFQQISTNKYISSIVTIAVFAEEFLITIKSENAKIMVVIKYVHELQHALRLAGIKKTIEL